MSEPTPHAAFRCKARVNAAGRIAFNVPLPPGTRVEVIVIAPQQDDSAGRTRRAAKSTGFWVNPFDDDRFEAVDGRLVALPPDTAYSNWVTGNVLLELGSWAAGRQAGTVLTGARYVLRSAPALQRRPSVAFVSSGRWPLDRPIPDGDAWAVVPDLVVEVASPSNPHDALLAKLREYFDHGVRQAWIVDSLERAAYIYDPATEPRVLGRGDILESLLLPGFSVRLNELFQDQ